MTLGALVGLSVLVVHSSFASGDRVVGVALLAVVVGAYLSGLAGKQRGNQRDLDATTQFLVPLGKASAMGGAIVLTVLGVIMFGQNWRAYRVEVLARAAMKLETFGPGSAQGYGLQSLASAVQLAPADAQLQRELAHAHLQAYTQKSARLKKSTRMMEAAEAMNSIAIGKSGVYPFSNIVAWHIAVNWHQHLQGEKQAVLIRHHLLAALRHWLNARDLSVLAPEPQWRIANYVYLLGRADAPRDYLERAMQVAPRDPEVYYQVGLQEMATGHPEQAFNRWKQSLDLSDAYLGSILERSRRQLRPELILRRLVAERPEQVLLAARYLCPDPESSCQPFAPFFEKVLQLLKDKPRWEAQDFHFAAAAFAGLGDFSKAREAFKTALDQEPNQSDWRMEFANCLYHGGRYQEAQSQLLTLLELQPSHQRAHNLLAEVQEHAWQIEANLAEVVGPPLGLSAQKMGNFFFRLTSGLKPGQ